MPRKPGHDKYHAERFQAVLGRLIDNAGESHRGASTAAGLDSSAISRYMGSTRPSRDACIALADHFGINPNVMLEAAGYKPLRFFDGEKIDLSQVRPEAKEILERLEGIADPKGRAHLYQVIGSMLEGYQLAKQMDRVTNLRRALEQIENLGAEFPEQDLAEQMFHIACDALKQDDAAEFEEMDTDETY
jgi:hypothetical protein